MHDTAPAPPVLPTPEASAAHRPLPAGAARIEGGFWGSRLETNRDRAIRGGYDRLEEAGMLRNLHLAAGTEQGEPTPLIFADSDLYKWLEAVAFEIGRTGDAQLLELQRRVTGWIAQAQDEDGYLDTVHDLRHGKAARWSNLTFHHELYCAGHLIQAAIAQHRCTGDTGLLEVATRFADLIAATFGPGGRDGTPGHPEIEMALVELFRETGERRYLETAEFFLDRRGHGVLHAETGVNPSYFSDRVPVREATSVEGHAVRAVYLAAGATDRALETGDAEHLAQQEALFADMMTTKAYVSGGLGSRWEGESFGAPYELPADRGYAETCAAIGAVQWAWRLLLATGRSRYADAIEHLLLNAMLPGISLDGTGYFYVNPLQVRSGAVAGDDRDPAGGRQGWFDCACCPPNVMRTLASLAQYVATAGGGVRTPADGDAASSDGGGTATADGAELALHQYVQGRFGVEPGLVLDVVTDYPLQGRIEITVARAPSGPGALRLRVPGWAVTHRLELPAHLASAAGEGNREGTVQVTGRFAPGDRIVLELPMEARFVAAHPRNDSVAGAAAVFRGPLLYALEQQDQDEHVDLEQAVLLPEEGAGLAPAPAALAALPGGDLPVLELVGRSLPAPAEEPYPAWDAAAHRALGAEPETGERTRLRAIPYFAWANREIGPMRVWMPARASQHRQH